MSTDDSAGTARFGENSSSGGTSNNAALAAIEGGEPSSRTSGVASSFSSGSDVIGVHRNGRLARRWSKRTEVAVKSAVAGMVGCDFATYGGK